MADYSRTDRRFIEDEIPLAEVNQAASKEKLHPRRPLELLHLWPSRKPRSASRLAIAATLLKVPSDLQERERRLNLLGRLCVYEPSQEALQHARELIRLDCGGRAPRVLDMFSGGGAIPLEAANLGCEAHAVELNPVAHLIELAGCVYPQRYGERLQELVQRWSGWVLEEARKAVGDLYPVIRVPREQADRLAYSSEVRGKKKAEGAARQSPGRGKKAAKSTDGEQLGLAGMGRTAAPQEESPFIEVQPLGYLWTRTVPCHGCGGTVPLVMQTWLCRKEGRSIALKLMPDHAQKRVHFELRQDAAIDFKPDEMSERGAADCPLCGAAILLDKVKEHSKAGRMDTQLMAAVGAIPGEWSRLFVPADLISMPDDRALRKRLADMGEEVWPGPAGLEMPDSDTLNFKTPLYGLTRFCDLFTPRQAVALVAFSSITRAVYDQVHAETGDADLAKAVTTQLALMIDKLADHNNSLCRWHPSDQKVVDLFARQAIPMVWNFIEENPFADIAGSYPMHRESAVQCIAGLRDIPATVHTHRTSATRLDFLPADSLDAIITDPPYYDYISYADLSDFFYVWLKRILGDLYPEHLSGDKTPKKQEAVVVPYRHEGSETTAFEHFISTMAKAFEEAHRVLKPGAPMVIVYAHKTVAGWATLVQALHQAGFQVTEAWPLRTESMSRSNAMDTAALATSIFLVARRRDIEQDCNDYEDTVLSAARTLIDRRTAELWQAGLGGADLIIPVIGAALAPFTQYKVVRRGNGDEVSPADYLIDAQRLATNRILDEIIRRSTGTATEETSLGASAIDAPTRLYILVRAYFGDSVLGYDDLKNLAIGILSQGEVDGVTGALCRGAAALFHKDKGKVQLRSFCEPAAATAAKAKDRGALPELGLSESPQSASHLIDILHRLLWLQRSAAAEVPAFLQKIHADLEAVRLVAQVLSGPALRSGAAATAEQSAISTLLASWGSITKSRAAGPLFNQPGA